MSQDVFILDPPSNSRELSDWCFSSLLKLLTTIESWALFPHYQTGIIAETSPVWRIQGRLTFQSEHGGIWVTTTMSFLAGCLLATVLCVWRSFEAKLWHHKKKCGQLVSQTKFDVQRWLEGDCLWINWHFPSSILIVVSFSPVLLPKRSEIGPQINECQKAMLHY